MKFDKSYFSSKSFWLDSILSFAIALGIFFSIQWKQPHIQPSSEVQSNTTAVVNVPTQKFGFDLSQFYFEPLKIAKNQVIGSILSDYGVPHQKIALLESKAKDIFSVRKIRSEKDLIMVREDECDNPFCFVYEPDPFHYVVYDLRDDVNVEMVEKEVVTYVKTASGKLETSLWNAMIERGFSPALIDKMEDALAWSVDFFHVQVGDEFKLIYEEQFVDGKPVAIGKLLGAYYKNNLEHYAIYFENDNYNGFYDLEGRATKKAFLKSPVKYSRISSRYNLNRFHPVLKRRKPHLGTDYAAAHGTPIRAIGNGVVIRASYTRGNGKYVKIKHDGVYQSQYLHMSGFAKGIRSGQHVSQGQVIGYVGQTGLATGPHVCFRFWKHGKQIDFLRQNFPPPKPMDDADLPEFFESRDQMVFLLDRISINKRDGNGMLASIVSPQTIIASNRYY